MLTASRNENYSFVFLTCHNFSRDYSILSKLGEGDTANVFLVLERSTNTRYALKAFNHKNLKCTFN